MTALRDRIVGEGMVDPADLLANPFNWRIHPQAQRDVLRGVLEEVGWVAQVIVNTTTGHVIDGHLRIDLAIERGEAEVPVLYVDLSEAEERLVLATLDPIATMATTDAEVLSELLEGVAVADENVAAMLERIQAGAPPLPEPGEEAEQIHECPSCGAKWTVGPRGGKHIVE